MSGRSTDNLGGWRSVAEDDLLVCALFSSLSDMRSRDVLTRLRGHSALGNAGPVVQRIMGTLLSAVIGRRESAKASALVTLARWGFLANFALPVVEQSTVRPTAEGGFRLMCSMRIRGATQGDWDRLLELVRQKPSLGWKLATFWAVTGDATGLEALLDAALAAGGTPAWGLRVALLRFRPDRAELRNVLAQLGPGPAAAARVKHVGLVFGVSPSLLGVPKPPPRGLTPQSTSESWWQSRSWGNLGTRPTAGRLQVRAEARWKGAAK